MLKHGYQEPECFEGSNYIQLDDFPGRFVEEAGESIGPWRLLI